MRETDPLLGHSEGRNGDASRQARRQSKWVAVKSHLGQSVDANKSGTLLALQCFMSGAADAAVFSHTNTWAAFMTGNLTQLSMSAITLLLTHPAPAEATNRLQSSSAAVGGFIVGAFIASKVDAAFHGKHRGKLAITSLIRSIVFALMGVYIYHITWANKAMLAVIFMLAVNMGTLAVNANRLGATPYATTVVFTASLSQVFSDPLLPLSLSSASQTRAISVLSLIFGAACSQSISILASRLAENQHLLFGSTFTILQQSASTGSAFAIGLVALVDLLSAWLWLQVDEEAD